MEPSMKRVDTCAAEFEAATPYMYSSYDGSCECEPTTERKVGVPQVFTESFGDYCAVPHRCILPPCAPLS